VGILEVEVEASGLDVVDGDAPGLLGFLAGLEAVFLGAPPLFLGVELGDADGFGLVVALGSGRVGMLVIPDGFGGGSFGEEEEVGLDAGVGSKDAIGQADDGVEVAVGEELFLDAGLHAFSEEGAIGQDESGAATGLEELHDEDEEEVGGLAGAEIGGKVGLDAVFLHAAEGWVGGDEVHALLRAPIAERAGEGVVVADVGGNIDAVEEEIGEAEDVREVLLLNAGEAFLDGGLVYVELCLFPQVADEAGDEAAGAGGGIKELLAEARVQAVDDELGDGPWSIELTGIACGLEVLEQFLIDIAEHVAVLGGIEVDGVDLVDDLPHQGAIFHVIVGVIEGGADEGGEFVAASGEVLELGQKGVVDEVEEGVAGDAFLVGGPSGPAEFLGQGGFVVVPEKFHFFLPVVEDFEEEQPAELFEALGVTIGAGILAHDVLDGFDDVGDVGHGLEFG